MDNSRPGCLSSAVTGLFWGVLVGFAIWGLILMAMVLLAPRMP
jgi:hypothetical protein